MKQQFPVLTPSQPLATPILFSTSMKLLFCVPHIMAIIQYLSFCVFGLFHLAWMSWIRARSVLQPVSEFPSLLRLSNIPWYSTLICLAIGKHLGCLLSVVSDPAMNVSIHMSVHVSQFFWVCTRKWDCWIRGYLYFEFFKEPPHCFPCGSTVLHSRQHCTRLPISPHPCQLWLFSGWLWGLEVKYLKCWGYLNSGCHSTQHCHSLKCGQGESHGFESRKPWIC